jgi:hypothetical protein
MHVFAQNTAGTATMTSKTSATFEYMSEYASDDEFDELVNSVEQSAVVYPLPGMAEAQLKSGTEWMTKALGDFQIPSVISKISKRVAYMENQARAGLVSEKHAAELSFIKKQMALERSRVVQLKARIDGSVFDQPAPREKAVGGWGSKLTRKGVRSVSADIFASPGNEVLPRSKSTLPPSPPKKAHAVLINTTPLEQHRPSIHRRRSPEASPIKLKPLPRRVPAAAPTYQANYIAGAGNNFGPEDMLPLPQQSWDHYPPLPPSGGLSHEQQDPEAFARNRWVEVSGTEFLVLNSSEGGSSVG